MGHGWDSGSAVVVVKCKLLNINNYWGPTVISIVGFYNQFGPRYEIMWPFVDSIHNGHIIIH